MNKVEKTAEQAAGKGPWAGETAGRRDAKRGGSRHSRAGDPALGRAEGQGNPSCKVARNHEPLCSSSWVRILVLGNLRGHMSL